MTLIDRKTMRACLLVAIALVSAAGRASPFSAVPPPAETRTILVFPFENRSARRDLDWMSEGFTEVVSSRLAGPARYVLGRDERFAAYDELGVPNDTPLTLASEFKVGETLGVDWVVVGSFTVEGDRLTARARLLDMRRLKLRPEIEATGLLADVADLETRLAWRLLSAEDPDFTTGLEEDFARQFPVIRLDAFENYVRGTLATDPESREHFLKESDRLNPADHAAAFELGRHFFDRKDYADSATWLRKLTAADPDYYEALFMLGVDEFFLGHEPEAEKAFAALAREVPLGEVSNNLGVIEARRGRYADALASFERAYQGDPSDPDYAFNLGACLWYLKQYNLAAKRLAEAVHENDDDLAAHVMLAAALSKVPDEDGARREQQWLARHGGSSTPSAAEDVLPWTRIRKHYDGRAFRLLSLTVRNATEATLAKEDPESHGAVHRERGQQLLTEGRLIEAERELTEAAQLIPKDAEVHLALGQVYELESRHANAATELEKSLAYHDSAAAHVWLARVYLALNRIEAARSQNQLALGLDPENRYAKSLVEQIQLRTRNKDDDKVKKP